MGTARGVTFALFHQRRKRSPQFNLPGGPLSPHPQLLSLFWPPSLFSPIFFLTAARGLPKGKGHSPPHGVPDEPPPQQETHLPSTDHDSGQTPGQRVSCKAGPAEVTGTEPVVPKEPLTAQPAGEGGQTHPSAHRSTPPSNQSARSTPLICPIIKFS